MGLGRVDAIVGSNVPSGMAHCPGFLWTEEVPGTLTSSFETETIPGKAGRAGYLTTILRKQEKDHRIVPRGLCHGDTFRSSRWK